MSPLETRTLSIVGHSPLLVIGNTSKFIDFKKDFKLRYTKGPLQGASLEDVDLIELISSIERVASLISSIEVKRVASF